MGFEEYNPHLAPIPVNGPFGRQYHAAGGALQDDELDLLRAAVLNRLPSRCADDALDLLGAICRIPRYDGETHASYRARLVAAWTTWELAGSAVAIETQIRAYGVPDVRVYCAWEGDFSPDPASNYAAFWVFLGTDYGTSGIAELDLGSWTLGEYTLGSTATIAQIRAIKRIILKWKAAHGYPVKVQLIFGAGPILGIGVGVATPPLTLGSFTLGGASTIFWPIGRTLGDTLPGLGSITLGGYEI